MKKILSVVLTAAFVMMNTAAFADNASADAMKEALIKVKERIEVPSELSVFESRSEVINDEMRFSFTWRSTDEYSGNLNVSADQYGNISEYYYYKQDLYKDKTQISDMPKADYFNAALDFMKKTVPQLFETESDRLVPVEDGSIIRNEICNFNWIRQKDGIDVVSNTARACVMYTDSGFVVTEAEINWDYRTEFSGDYDKVIEHPEAKYSEQYPIELVYSPQWNITYKMNGKEQPPRLIYRFKNNDIGYILAQTGEKAEADSFFEVYENEKAMYSAADSGAGGGSRLTEQELTELDNVSGLLTPAQIVERVNALGVFGKLPEASEFSSRVSGKDGRYYISLYYSKDSKYINIMADGKTGQILNVYNNEYSKDYDPEKKYSDKEYERAREVIDKFLEKNYADEVSACIEPTETKDDVMSLSMVRTVNGVKYLSDGISASYDMERGVISQFALDWTNDTSEFPDPTQAIPAEKAAQLIFENAPVKLFYVKINNAFTLCYKADTERAVEINALSGELINDYPSNIVRSYTDISGHWAEKQIKCISEHGSGLPGSEFMPDSDITQFDLLRMLASGVSYYRVDTDEVSFYEGMIRDGIITEEEKNPQAAVSREDAFVYLIRFMGLSKIASMNEIFQTGFADGSDISAEKVGSIAILRGYGIVSGDGVSIRPKDNITRAEAAALLYAHLTAEK
ncbi:MAG: S-layer homology domain-containing protein [Clostridia bacterium]|nr:S-layer homology domain-containing protein [Clostridia bacterium]